MINCRKICQHCKCPREDHNIIEDDARTGCNVYLGEANHSGLPSDDDSGCALDEYAWVPPGLNPEQASGVNLERLSYLHVLLLIRRISLSGILVRIFVINVVLMLQMRLGVFMKQDFGRLSLFLNFLPSI